MTVGMLVMGGDFTCYCVVYNVIMNGQAFNCLATCLPACQHHKASVTRYQEKIKKQVLVF
jgi:hypothetical protein